MPVTGGAEHLKRLRKIRGPLMVRALTAVVFGEAKALANDASRSITAGSTSGAKHEASAPGEPPNADTQVLNRSITAEVVAPLKAETYADAPYAAAQELGDEKRNLPERPYLRPAAARRRPIAVRNIAEAVNKVIVKSGT